MLEANPAAVALRSGDRPRPQIQGQKPKRSAPKFGGEVVGQGSRTIKLLEASGKEVERFKNGSEKSMFVFGDVTVNFSAMEAVRNGELVVFTTGEFKTLKYLIQNAGRVISREELLNDVWGYENYPCTRTVDNRILRLRQKLELDPARPVHFRTVYGTGYKFLPYRRYGLCRDLREGSGELKSCAPLDYGRSEIMRRDLSAIYCYRIGF